MARKDSYLSMVYEKSIPDSMKPKLKGEKVQWVGRPERIPYIFLPLSLALLGIYILVFFSFIILSAYSAGLSIGFTAFAMLSLIAANALIIVPLFSSFHEWSEMLYVITSDKVVFRKSNRDKLYLISEINKIVVDEEGFVDHLFNTGTVEVYLRKDDEILQNIKDYRKVSRLLSK